MIPPPDPQSPPSNRRTPGMAEEAHPSKPLQDLLDIMDRLRDPDSGCPWDLEQTFASIVPYTIEEAYEVADAIREDDTEQLISELGDLLFHVVFFARMLQERGESDFYDIATRITRKMIRRHPHVFSDVEQTEVEGIATAWEAQKSDERAERARREGRRPGALDDVARSLPALVRAQKIQRRAADVGFDWDNVAPVIAKVREELEEFEAEVDGKASRASTVAEAGDLLFACVNLARHVGIDAEIALRLATDTFETRFRGIEEMLASEDRTPSESDMGEMDALWRKVKAKESRHR